MQLQPVELLFVVMIHRFPEGTDVVAQCTVALVSGSGDNGDGSVRMRCLSSSSSTYLHTVLALIFIALSMVLQLGQHWQVSLFSQQSR